jgi:hypothetical protein
MDQETLQFRARRMVVHYFNTKVPKTSSETIFEIEMGDVFVVWFCKTLQNWKALVATEVCDGCYFEVTHNGDKNETYIDYYKKVDNVVMNQDPMEALRDRLGT